MDSLAEKYIDTNGGDIWIFYKDDDGNEQHWVFNGSNHKQAPKTKDNFTSNFLMAYDYNIRNGGGEFMQLAATSKDLTINLKYGENTLYIPNPRDGSAPYIQWNPNLGIKTDGGHVLSPATILEHEADHNVRRIQDPNGFMEDAGYKSNGYRYVNDSQYDFKEERRVIRGSERNTAYNNREFPLNYVRPDHDKGSFITVTSPISTGLLMPAVRRNIMNKQRSIVPSILRTLRGGGR
ncbi:hypothetical protein [Dysgonomonas mossii]|uniref:hypothetical protein n=1 Tax=Dysgonomonas mossii TaxID=163665 RepID=UPI0039951941